MPVSIITIIFNSYKRKANRAYESGRECGFGYRHEKKLVIFWRSAHEKTVSTPMRAWFVHGFVS